MSARARTRTLLDEGDGSVVRRTTLDSGLRIITESVPGVRSVAVGAWVGVGSRDETARQRGAAHFLEHLLFKGTRRRSAWEISTAVESVGGEMNAFTTKEYTCYHARVLDRDMPIAVDVVCDLVSEGALTTADIEGERLVILEEIAMTEDDPADVVHDLSMAAQYGDTPLGRPILGTIESIRQLSPQGIRSFYRGRYEPSRMVIAVAGCVDHGQVVREVRRSLRRFEEYPSAEPVREAAEVGSSKPPVTPAVVQQRPTEQANLVLGFPGLSRHDDRRWALAVLNAAVGGGMSSRLFQAIREERGLAYSVFSFATHYRDTGMWGVYAGCLPDKVTDVVTIAREVLADIAESGLPEDDLRRARGQVTGGVVLGQEDTLARMSRIGKSELHYGRVPSVGDLLATIDAVDVDAVRDVAAQVLSAPPTLSVIGPVDTGRMESLAATR